jgi:hypothetical protein
MAPSRTGFGLVARIFGARPTTLGQCGKDCPKDCPKASIFGGALGQSKSHKLKQLTPLPQKTVPLRKKNPGALGHFGGEIRLESGAVWGTQVRL